MRLTNRLGVATVGLGSWLVLSLPLKAGGRTSNGVTVVLDAIVKEQGNETDERATLHARCQKN